MQILPARPHHVPALMNIVTACVAHMRGRGIMQWDETYPNPERFERDAEACTLYMAVIDDVPVGTICLNAEQDEAYQQVTWAYPEPALVVHRLCVSPAHQGLGIGRALMELAERTGREQGSASIRLDAYSGNPSAMGLYLKLGYTIAGEVFFPRRPLPFHCLEKKL